MVLLVSSIQLFAALVCVSDFSLYRINAEACPLRYRFTEIDHLSSDYLDLRIDAARVSAHRRKTLSGR